MLDHRKPILVIPDSQKPYEHEKALAFCTDLRRKYKIPSSNILHTGDEIDIFHGSAHKKGAEYRHSPTEEIMIVREKIKEWAKAFPKMKLCTSNHGLRWIRKAFDAEIPSVAIKDYKELYEIPKEWEYRQEWRFTDLPNPFRMIHGQGYSGKDGHRNAALDGGISTVIGHLHSFAAIDYIRTLNGYKIWAVNAGCLIDVESFAFDYGKYNRNSPCLGALTIHEGGRVPIFHPME
ncbi:MAG: hypothetical protein EBX40_02000 [Gammaproteobacteria bacterium]|nr:hypothetical protein [Gammaproteobacteria bacterium]